MSVERKLAWLEYSLDTHVESEPEFAQDDFNAGWDARSGEIANLKTRATSAEVILAHSGYGRKRTL